MKYIVIILTFLSASLALYSQDSEPEPFKFDYGDTTDATLSIEDCSVKDTFMLFWQWGMPFKLSRALYMNGGHGHSVRADDNPGSSSPMNFMIYPVYHYYNESEGKYKYKEEFVNHVGTWNAAAMQFEPLLKINPDNPTEFDTTQNRQRGAIWGFRFIHDSIDVGDTDTVLNLLQSEFQDFVDTGAVVLKEPWMNNQFTRHHGGKNGPDIINDSLYLAVNLKRLSEVDTLDYLRNYIPTTFGFGSFKKGRNPAVISRRTNPQTPFIYYLIPKLQHTILIPKLRFGNLAVGTARKPSL